MEKGMPRSARIDQQFRLRSRRLGRHATLRLARAETCIRFNHAAELPDVDFAVEPKRLCDQPCNEIAGGSEARDRQYLAL
jgi:hypothetical protein